MGDLAFIDVDTQFDLMMPEGKFYVPGASGIVPSLWKITFAATDLAIPIIGCIDMHEEGDAEFERFPPHCIQGTPGANKIAATTLDNTIYIERNAEEGGLDFSSASLIILKKNDMHAGIFANPFADKLLSFIGKKTFAVYGVPMEYSVRGTALGLIARGYDVVVLTDAVRAIDPFEGDKILSELEKKGARFATTNGFLKEIES